jgi:hypothetical protein
MIIEPTVTVSTRGREGIPEGGKFRVRTQMGFWQRLFRLEAKASLSAPDLSLREIFTGDTTVDAPRVPSASCAVRAIAETVATLYPQVQTIGAGSDWAPRL